MLSIWIFYQHINIDLKVFSQMHVYQQLWSLWSRFNWNKCFALEVRKFHNLATNTNKNRYSGIQEIYKATEKDVWAFEGWARNKIYEAVQATISATGLSLDFTPNQTQRCYFCKLIKSKPYMCTMWKHMLNLNRNAVYPWMIFIQNETTCHFVHYSQ